jgi:hypothetical protein
LVAAVLRDVGEAIESVAVIGDWQSLCEQNAALENDLGNARHAAEKATRAADTFREMLRAAEAERDAWRDKHDTLAITSRACLASAERERDEARAEARRGSR